MRGSSFDSSHISNGSLVPSSSVILCSYSSSLSTHSGLSSYSSVVTKTLYFLVNSPLLSSSASVVSSVTPSIFRSQIDVVNTSTACGSKCANIGSLRGDILHCRNLRQSILTLHWGSLPQFSSWKLCFALCKALHFSV